MAQPDAPLEVVAAIAAAVDAVWPRPVIIDEGRELRVPDVNDAPLWRFSARSWSKPIASRRERPGR